MTCGEPVPFRDPSGQYECTLDEHGDERMHECKLYGADGVKYVTYQWKAEW